MTPLPILADRSGVLAVVKPAGLPTQAPPEIDSVESRVRQWLSSRQPHTADTPYLGVPHRLDRAVSGVLLFAATPRAARKLSRQFERRDVLKTYLALLAVHREPDLPPPGADPVVWHDWIEKVPDEPRGRVVAASQAGARQAETLASLLGRAAGPDGAEWLALRLEPRTGRMHQLRLQAASRGLPVIGDELYGGPACLEPAATSDPRSRPIALHAWRIGYADPDSGQPITIEAPLPTWWPEIPVNG